jgi:DivIVA domain-containing protein
MDFTVVLRGYDREEVDSLVERVREALELNDVTTRAEVRELIRTTTFQRRFRGYECNEVDDYLRRMTDQLA